MSNYGILLLSKILDSNDVAALARYNIAEGHFTTEAERKAYRFIKDYAEQNRGQAPSYASVTAEVPDFYYVPAVEDSYEYLTRKLMNGSAEAEFMALVNNGEMASLFERNRDDMPTLISELQERLERIKIRTDVRNKVGTDIKTDTEKFKAEYERRKAGESFKLWRSRFPNIGAYVSGNLYTVYGKSGRGKSVITLEEGVEMALQGANVLIWAMEMPWFEVLVRIYVSVSARKQLTTLNVGGLDLTGGFDAGDLRKGTMTDEFEEAFHDFLAKINDELPGNIIVRGVDDPDFGARSLRQLEADILQTKADVVIIDPFYYLDYERNTSKTAGGDAAETSKKLRRLTGQLQVVTLAITQADEAKTETGDDGMRELELPQRAEVKKTKALLEDAALLIAVDTDYKQGRGLVGINKGRDGGEGDVVEIMYVPQIGVVRPLLSEELAADFDF